MAFRAQAERFGAEIETVKASKVDFASQPYGVWVGDPAAPEPTHRARVIIISTGAQSLMLGLDREIELVCLRLRARVPRPPRRRRKVARRRLLDGAAHDSRTVHFAHVQRPVKAPILARDVLEPGHVFAGPAVIEEYSGTTLVPPGTEVEVAPGGHLVLSIGEPGGRLRRKA